MTSNTKKEGLTNCQALVTYLVIVLGACYFFFNSSTPAPAKEDSEKGIATDVKTEGGTTLRILPLEFHARLNENGRQVTPEHQANVAKLAKERVVDEFVTPSEKTYIEVDKAWPIYLKGGKKGLTAKVKGKKFVHFPLMGTHLKLKKFYPVAKIYKDAGVDLSKEVLIEVSYKGTDGATVFLKGTDGATVFLPKYFAQEMLAAAKEAGVTPRIAWGVRDYNLQAVMWARTLLKCQADVSAYEGMLARKSKCEEYIKKEVGKPKKPSFTHMWSVDIKNWQQFKEQLWSHNFVVGCNSPLVEHDLRHATWNLPNNENTFSKAKCNAVGTWKSIGKLIRF